MRIKQAALELADPCPICGGETALAEIAPHPVHPISMSDADPPNPWSCSAPHAIDKQIESYDGLAQINSRTRWELKRRNKTSPSLIYWAEGNFNPTTKQEMTMFNNIKAALAAALIIGAASSAFAGNDIDESPSTAQSIRESRENQLPWWWNTPSTGKPGDAFGLAAAIHKPAPSHPKTRRDY